MILPRLAPVRPAECGVDGCPCSRCCGRDQDLIQVGELPSTSRLVTLVGAGAVGKSQPARQVAPAAVAEGSPSRGAPANTWSIPGRCAARADAAARARQREQLLAECAPLAADCCAPVVVSGSAPRAARGWGSWARRAGALGLRAWPGPPGGRLGGCSDVPVRPARSADVAPASSRIRLASAAGDHGTARACPEVAPSCMMD